MNKKIMIYIFIVLSFCSLTLLIWNGQMLGREIKTDKMEISQSGENHIELEYQTDKYIYVDTIQIKYDKPGEISICIYDKHKYKLKENTYNIEEKELVLSGLKYKLKEKDIIYIVTNQNVAESKISYASYTAIPIKVKIVMEMLLVILYLIIVMCIRKKEKIYVQIQSIIKPKAKMSSPRIIDYILWFSIFFIIFASLMYGDTKAFAHYGVNFWRSIAEGGGLRYFYEFSNNMIEYYKANQIGGAYEAIYDFPVFILFGIWNFPLWILYLLTGIEETSHFLTMLYSKSIYLVAIAFTAYMLYKVCINLKMNVINSKWAAYIFVTSATIFTEIGIAGQLDIIGMPFSLLGIYYFQKKDKWKFILFFSIAVSFKQFPLFIFIPLLFLIEKNILKITIDFCGVMAVTVLSGLPFPRNTVAMEANDVVRERFMEAFLGVKAPLFNSAIPIIVLIIGSICVYAYCKKISNQEELEQYSVFIPALTMFLLFISFDSNPYWFVHMAPYMAILIMYNSSKFNMLMLFETIGMICLTFYQYGQNYWIYESSLGRGMLLDQIFSAPDQLLSMKTFAGYTRLSEYAFVLFAGYILCIGACLLLSMPGKMKQADVEMIRPISIFRMLINGGISFIPVFLYFISSYI